ncbi:ATP synthase F1 subunit gamma [Candidatus Giovannonibacteria bacterium RIFCSPLOWO2_01_FULL_46_13]|uniref:ATP synthase gamma chain n=1 Tax=Candidatus Giovannonibacteria bacterium RIFCSPLOWO2_01_FULL_46_13 TaxID=1798352 RepID=A0A1F5X3L4_9BACT|nr:MAG: ATP synthase F1 subunit gamma [Candidatus Giovannonibacteria bacterium RIFCSPLOWO2_01_FULL_46_13]
MESLQSLNRRRKAVGNIGAITKAMEVVAAIKMRKSEEAALDSRPYAFKALDLLEKLSRVSKLESVLMRPRKVKKTMVVVITSDRGLIGSFNTQVLRVAENFLASDKKRSDQEHSYSFIAVGKKADAYLAKKSLPIIEKFYGFGDYIEVEEIAPLYEYLMQGFIETKWDRIVTISMHFRSALKQETLVREILPLDTEKIRQDVKEIIPEHGLFSGEKNGNRAGAEDIEYIFEPSPAELLANLIPHLLKMELYHLILEANASEHAARYVAMKSASDNAEELSEKLIIQYNKVRQAAITGEMVEMAATRSALK